MKKIGLSSLFVLLLLLSAACSEDADNPPPADVGADAEGDAQLDGASDTGDGHDFSPEAVEAIGWRPIPLSFVQVGEEHAAGIVSGGASTTDYLVLYDIRDPHSVQVSDVIEIQNTSNMFNTAVFQDYLVVLERSSVQVKATTYQVENDALIEQSSMVLVGCFPDNRGPDSLECPNTSTGPSANLVSNGERLAFVSNNWFAELDIDDEGALQIVSSLDRSSYEESFDPNAMTSFDMLSDGSIAEYAQAEPPPEMADDDGVAASVKIWTMEPALGEGPLLGSIVVEDAAANWSVYNSQTQHVYYGGVDFSGTDRPFIGKIDVSDRTTPTFVGRHYFDNAYNRLEVFTVDDRVYAYFPYFVSTPFHSVLDVLDASGESLTPLASRSQQTWPIPERYQRLSEAHVQDMRVFGDRIFISLEGDFDLEFPEVPIVAFERAALEPQ